MAIAVTASVSYGITRGFLSDDLPPYWAGGQVLDTVLNHIRADPCNHPDASTARATLTTVDGARQILAERWGSNSPGGAGDLSPDRTPVWLVEVQGEIPVVGGLRGVAECENPPTGDKFLVFYIVTLDGDVETGYSRVIE